MQADYEANGVRKDRSRSTNGPTCEPFFDYLLRKLFLIKHQSLNFRETRGHAHFLNQLQCNRACQLPKQANLKWYWYVVNKCVQ